MAKTEDQKQRERDAERERSARRKRANERLKALPQASRDHVRRTAQRLEADHVTGPKITAVAYLEQALDAYDANAFATLHGDQRKAAVRPGTATGDGPPVEVPKSPKKGPRERSKPKEAGRPAPETKDPAQLAGNAKRARGGDAAIIATVAVSVPDGTAYCKGCDTTKAESEFWPLVLTAKSKRRGVCRTCYNKQWQEWTAKNKAKKAAVANT